MTTPEARPHQEKAHYPVMLNEVMTYLNVSRDGIYVDGTFGLGGYTNAILEKGAKLVIAFDQDPQAQAPAAQTKRQYGAGRFTFVQDNFRHLKQRLKELETGPIHGLVLDLGVSSPQLDQPGRGFSFLKEGPLDMRMAQVGQSAADVVNTATEQKLAKIFRELGEEKKANKIAKAIVGARKKEPFTGTTQLANVIKNQFNAREQHAMKIHPATRCFQALRIYINDELKALEDILKQAHGLLAEGGRLVVVCFHSLEDRIVKQAFTELSGNKASLLPKDLKTTKPQLVILTKKPLLPSEIECKENPRSRSAKLRAAERISDKNLLNKDKGN